MQAEKLFHRVLLLEDNSGHAMLIKRALSDCCAEVLHVVTVSEALKALEENKIELVISDLQLPDSTGTKHIARLKSKSPDCPIIVLTSSTSLQDAVEAMKHGARDYIVKQFDLDFKEILNLSLSRVYSALLLEAEKTRLQREMEVLRIAIENSDDGLAVFDTNGAPHYCNTAFKRFVKRCNGKLDDLSELFSPSVVNWCDLNESLVANFKNFSPGAVWNTEINFVDDPEHAYEFSFSAIRVESVGEQESRNEAVLWVRDISDLKRRERFQREILSTTTHDLKGPLGAILVSSELLKDSLSQDSKEYQIALRIASSAQGALNLIDEFLSAHRIRAGSLILKPARCRVADVLQDVIENNRTIADARSIRLEYRIADPELECLVDKFGLSRVVGNLVSNALKFTARGGLVRIDVGSKEGNLLISVEDTGTGIEPAEIRKIFERFSRLDKHSDLPGSGLGLFVVKSIVDAHGGSIEVTSRAGEGTRFTVMFPESPPVNERGELFSLAFEDDGVSGET